MPPRNKPGEVPKPMVQSGAFGCLPFNALTVSCLHAGYADRLVDFKVYEEDQPLPCRTSAQLLDGRKKVSVSLEGRLYNGYAEALYRGRLPEVLLAAPATECLPIYLQDLIGYIQKLCALGFFLNKKYLNQRNPVAELIPCTILAGDGLLFSRFVTGLMTAMKKLASDYPALDESMRLKILGRFVRGFPEAGQASAILGAANVYSGSLPLVAFSPKLRIAGGDRETQQIIQEVLSAHGLVTVVENQTRNAVERLELENALWRLSDVILPALVARDCLSAADAQIMAPQLARGVMTIGVKRQALDASEVLRPETLSGKWTNSKNARKKANAGKNTSAQDEISLGWGDVAIVAGLNACARELNLSEESRLFETLTRQLLPYCEQEV